MFRKINFLLTILLSVACSLSFPSPATPTTVPANVNNYAIFSINVQDFSYPEQSPLLLQAERDAIWAMYEQTVLYVASQNNCIGIVNLPMVLGMIR